MDSHDHLFDLLRAYESKGAFNPYRDSVADLDRPGGAAIRRRNLRRYLKQFEAASYVLVGEAAGYAGCRFSGIPFTGEAQIVGPEALPWARRLAFEQSSRGEPWRERSGQIVWEGLGTREDCVLWNAFPWHPCGEKPLSNRRPTRSELKSAREVLTCFLSLYPGAKACAIGRVSEQALRQLGIAAPYIRHPSHGGKAAFIESVSSLPPKLI